MDSFTYKHGKVAITCPSLKKSHVAIILLCNEHLSIHLYVYVNEKG